MAEGRAAQLLRVIRELDSIVERARDLEALYAAQLDHLHPGQVEAGRNLLHYLALRHSDIRDLQDELASLGLSSLGRCEAHVLWSVDAVRHAIETLLGRSGPRARVFLNRPEGHARLRRNTNALFGRKRSGSLVRIMVTMPIEAAEDYVLVRDMLRAGMNCARINCSAGAAQEWEGIVRNVHRARAATGRGCRIFMDLSGPKIRTGALAPGPEVVRLAPDIDAWGRPEEPASVELFRESAGGLASFRTRIPVSDDVFEALAPGRVVEFSDTRGLARAFAIDSVCDGVARARCWDEAYLESGTALVVADGDGRTVARGSVGRLTGKRPGIHLDLGDTLVIHADPRPGEGAREADDGSRRAPAHVPCAIPEVLEHVDVGHEVVLDDGKFRGIARAVRPGELIVEITHAAPGGAKLREGKGMNFPDSRVGLFGLTDKDREDLPFVVAHADAVEVSFVNHPDDVEDVLDALDAAGGEHLGLVLKIETLMGVRRLPGILLAAMEWPTVGVMIARGDLAAEVGWTRLARAQEEILWLCEAAHFPVVWATEVLSQLAKTGIPTRGEISDVVMAERAECVMLNKGPHITDAIRTLDTILTSMEEYQIKKTALLPALPLEAPDPSEVGRSVGARLGRWGHRPAPPGPESMPTRRP